MVPAFVSALPAAEGDEDTFVEEREEEGAGLGRDLSPAPAAWSGSPLETEAAPLEAVAEIFGAPTVGVYTIFPHFLLPGRRSLGRRVL